MKKPFNHTKKISNKTFLMAIVMVFVFVVLVIGYRGKAAVNPDILIVTPAECPLEESDFPFGYGGDSVIEVGGSQAPGSSDLYDTFLTTHEYADLAFNQLQAVNYPVNENYIHLMIPASENPLETFFQTYFEPGSWQGDQEMQIFPPGFLGWLFKSIGRAFSFRRVKNLKLHDDFVKMLDNDVVKAGKTLNKMKSCIEQGAVNPTTIVKWNEAQGEWLRAATKKGVAKLGGDYPTGTIPEHINLNKLAEDIIKRADELDPS